MKNTISLITLCLALASCSNRDQAHVKSLDSVTNMPPIMHSSENYIQIDQTLLATKKDLSCGMSLKSGVADTMSYKGKLYGFCGAGCKKDFAKDPITHLQNK